MNSKEALQDALKALKLVLSLNGTHDPENGWVVELDPKAKEQVTQAAACLEKEINKGWAKHLREEVDKKQTLGAKAGYGKLLNNSIKTIAEKHGWVVKHYFNDKRKGFYRLSYCTPRVKTTEEQKTLIRQDVEALLENFKLKGEVYWTGGTARWGYDKLCIRIPNS